MSRDLFFRMLWTTPVKQLAVDLNIMPGDLRELVALYELPLPGKVSWMNLPRRERLKHLPPLPPHSRPELLPAEWPFQKPGNDKIGRYGLFVPRSLPRTLHPIAKATNAALAQAGHASVNEINVTEPGLFPCRTEPKCKERAVTFIDALLKLFVRLKFPISSEDVIEVRCFGVWFAFELQYRKSSDSQRKAQAPKIVLHVTPQSPAYRGRQRGSFYGRGDKPLEASFNTVLIWLLHTALGIRDGEEAWSDAERATHGTPEERFTVRRAEMKRRWEKTQAEADREASRSAARASYEAQKDEEARSSVERSACIRDHDRAAPSSLSPDEIRERIANRTCRDESAKLTRQEAFLWTVQTVVLATHRPSSFNNAESDDLLQGSTERLVRLLGEAVSSSYIIPSDLGTSEAAREFLQHHLPEGKDARSVPPYSAPEWMGLPTLEELNALIAFNKAEDSSGGI